jgi:hypothetical protein
VRTGQTGRRRDSVFVKPEVNGGPPEVPDLLKSKHAAAVSVGFRFDCSADRRIVKIAQAPASGSRSSVIGPCRRPVGRPPWFRCEPGLRLDPLAVSPVRPVAKVPLRPQLRLRDPQPRVPTVLLNPRPLRRSDRMLGRAVRTDGEIPMATSGGVSMAACGIPIGRCRLGLEHDPRGDSAGFDVGDRLVYLVERSCFADHACLAGGVQFEHLA